MNLKIPNTLRSLYHDIFSRVNPENETPTYQLVYIFCHELLLAGKSSDENLENLQLDETDIKSLEGQSIFLHLAVCLIF